MIHRTFREIRALRDNSNDTLRFNRSLQEAGWHGGLEEDEGRTAGSIILWGVVGSLFLWLFLIVVLGWS